MAAAAQILPAKTGHVASLKFRYFNGTHPLTAMTQAKILESSAEVIPVVRRVRQEFVFMIGRKHAQKLLRRHMAELVLAEPLELRLTFPFPECEGFAKFSTVFKEGLKHKLKTPQRIDFLSACGRFRLNLKPTTAIWYLQAGFAKVLSPSLCQFLLPDVETYEIRNGMQRKRVCVACGSRHILSSHHVIPKCYLRHLFYWANGNEWLFYGGHDKLLTCSSCHNYYEQNSIRFREQLGDECGYPHTSCGISSLNHFIAVAQSWSNRAQEFFEVWRVHFLHTMSPAFLPADFDVQQKVL